VAAAVALVPAISEEVQQIAADFLRARIRESDAQWMLRGALLIAALKRCRGHRGAAARMLDIPVWQFNKWVEQMALERTAGEIKRVCGAQLDLGLKRPAGSELRTGPQLDAMANPQDLRSRRG
jgi:hypothetical protein